MDIAGERRPAQFAAVAAMAEGQRSSRIDLESNPSAKTASLDRHAPGLASFGWIRIRQRYEYPAGGFTFQRIPARRMKCPTMSALRVLSNQALFDNLIGT
jgi:hypothetical protein